MKLAIVTGGNRGIGLAIVKGLWEQGGYEIVIACRSTKSGEEAKDSISKLKGSGELHVLQLDLCDFASVRRFVSDIKAKFKSIYALFNNAGILRWKDWIASKDGFEEHLQANHLGHFLLTKELIPLLIKDRGSRVVAVGSHLADYAVINWENMNDKEGFDAYKQSKLANLLHTQELHRLYAAHPHCLYSVTIDPGEVNTDITRFFPFASVINVFLKFVPERNTPEQGADSAVWFGTCGEEQAEALSGSFIRDRKAVALGSGNSTFLSSLLLAFIMSTNIDMESHGTEAAKRMWDLSDELVQGKKKLPPRETKAFSEKLWAAVELPLAFLVIFLAFYIAKMKV